MRIIDFDVEIPEEYKVQVCRYRSSIDCFYCKRDDLTQYIQCKKEVGYLVSLETARGRKV